MMPRSAIIVIQCLLLWYIPQGFADVTNLRQSSDQVNNRMLADANLDLVGNNGAAGLLDNCQGDCDRDSECKSGLKCFQRTGTQKVPGCTGDKPEWKGFDFCYKPPVVPTPGTLKIVGNDGGPGFPLNACEGDCDKDSDCKSGLKCKQRKGNEAVPGCTGDKKSYAGTDFCYKP
jgi:hypothetical protein